MWSAACYGTRLASGVTLNAIRSDRLVWPQVYAACDSLCCVMIPYYASAKGAGREAESAKGALNQIDESLELIWSYGILCCKQHVTRVTCCATFSCLLGLLFYSCTMYICKGQFDVWILWFVILPSITPGNFLSIIVPNHPVLEAWKQFRWIKSSVRIALDEI